MVAPIKIPTSLPQGLDDLQAGDIVFLIMPKRRHTFGARLENGFTSLFQSFVQGDLGHKNTEHIGFIVEIDGQKRMAHLTFETFHDEQGDKAARLNHLKIWDPKAYLSIRSATIYRISDQNERKLMGQELSALVKELKQNEPKKKYKFHWWFIVEGWLRRMVNSMGFGHKNAYKPAKVHTKERKVQRSTICPKFVEDCFTIASQRLANKGHGNHFRSRYMNIHGVTMLKTMQSYLHNNTNYDCFAFAGPTKHERNKDKTIDEKRYVYLRLTTEVTNHLARLDQTKGFKRKNALAKAHAIRSALLDHADEVAMIQGTYLKSVNLLKHIAPALQINTGTHVGTPTSWKEVMLLAKSYSIYPEYYAKDTVPETKESMERYLDQELKYTRVQKEVYKKYRSLGYSDRAARFEANPTVLSCAENYRRMTKAASLTVAGLFPAACLAKIKVERTKTANGLRPARKA